MPDQFRIGVIGGGLIAQMVHLPLIESLPETFRLVSIADPSAKVRDGLSARHPGVRVEADWRHLIEAGGLDGVVVCSPQASHTEVVLAALDAGIHCLVEKPLCIDPADAETICRRRDESGLVVQVGHMKRYDAGFEAWIESIPDSAEDLRLIEVVTRDPNMGRPPFLPPGFIASDDIPADVRSAGAEQTREQVEAAVGLGDPATVQAFNYTYVGCLIHDVNLIHAALEKMGVEGPLKAITSSHWAEGNAGTISFQLPGGAAWNSSWLLLPGLEDFVEDATLFFGDQLHRVSFGPPYMRERPTVHEVIAGVDGAEISRRGAKVQDSYRVGLEHFRSCVVDGAICRTPPEHSHADLVALRDSFLARVR